MHYLISFQTLVPELALQPNIKCCDILLFYLTHSFYEIRNRYSLSVNKSFWFFNFMVKKILKTENDLMIFTCKLVIVV